MTRAPRSRLPTVWPPVPWLRTKYAAGTTSCHVPAERLSDEVEARREPGKAHRELRADRPEDHRDDQVHDERERRDAGFPPARDSRRPDRRRARASGAQTGAPHGSPGWTTAGASAPARGAVAVHSRASSIGGATIADRPV